MFFIADILESADGMVVELHEKDQSIALKKSFNWKHSIYLGFENGMR